MAMQAITGGTVPRPVRPDPTSHWATLMEQGRAGDRRAYDALLGEAGAWLHRYFRRRHDFDCSQPLCPWLAAIARFKWVDRLRRMQRESATPMMQGVVDSHENDVLACQAVAGLLGQLRPAQADAIRMVKLDGLSISEAAERSGQSPSLVKINIHRGLKRLAASCGAAPLAPAGKSLVSRIGKWCPEEDSNLHALASAST